MPEDANSPAAAPAPSLLELQRRLAQSQRVAALGALVGRLAHELGTPLHSISGHLDLVLDEPDLSVDARRRLEIVSGELGRLSVLIRRYLRRLRAPDPEATPTDVRAVVHGVVKVMDPLLQRRKIRVAFDHGEGTDAPLACDREQVEQVVVNLIQNACDAMPTGGHLTVRTSATPTGRTISVCDTGGGVSPDGLEHVFEPFFSTKGAGRGTGLGLAICREIARAHGGDVLLDSEPGVGTVVTLTLESLDPKRRDHA